MRISPEVFDSASRIALTIRSCSSLLRNSLVRILLPTRSRASAAKTPASAAESAKAAAISRRPAATATTYGKEHGAATAGRITPTAKSPQHSRNDDQHDQKNEEEPNTRTATTTTFFRNRLTRSLVLAANRLKDRIDSGGDPTFVIAIAKLRFDSVFGDVERGDVGQCAFQAVTDLDKHFAILNENKKDNAIATFLLADAPSLGDALRVICDIGVALHLREDRNHHLIRRFPLKLGKLFIETQCHGFGDNAGVIVEIPVRFWRNDFRRWGLCCQQCKESCNQQSDLFGAQHLWWQPSQLLHRRGPDSSGLRRGRLARDYRKVENHLMARRRSQVLARRLDSNSRPASAQGQN